MITNDRHYGITSTAAREFEEALARLDVVEAHRPPEMRQLMRDAMESQLADLREELAEYDARRAGRVAVPEGMGDRREDGGSDGAREAGRRE